MQVDGKSLKIYIAGPYTGSSEAEILTNVAAAVDAGLVLFKRGHHPYVPHLTHYVDLHARARRIPMEWEDYIAWDLPWVEACDALLLLKESRGALIELELAKRLGKVVLLSINDIPDIAAASTSS